MRTISRTLSICSGVSVTLSLEKMARTSSGFSGRMSAIFTATESVTKSSASDSSMMAWACSLEIEHVFWAWSRAAFCEASMKSYPPRASTSASRSSLTSATVTYLSSDMGITPRS